MTSCCFCQWTPCIASWIQIILVGVLQAHVLLYLAHFRASLALGPTARADGMVSCSVMLHSCSQRGLMRLESRAKERIGALTDYSMPCTPQLQNCVTCDSHSG